MEYNMPKLGQVVYSKSGRDNGKYFVVIQIVSPEYVLIADGNLRKLVKPKKKKLKHLTVTPDILVGIGEKFEQGKKVFDKEIGSALRAYAVK